MHGRVLALECLASVAALCFGACSSNAARSDSGADGGIDLDPHVDVITPDGDAGPTPRVVEDFACRSMAPDASLIGHAVCLDGQQKLVPWNDDPSPYADVAARAWNALKGVPNLPNGKPSYYSQPLFAGVPPDVWAPGTQLTHYPAGLLAMLTDSALRWYAYSGDRAVLTGVVMPFANHVLANGMTESTDAWASVPYSCADPGSLTYHGHHDNGNQSGDGYGYLEPDKVGEVGYAFLRLYEHSGQQKYRDVAVACADALVKHQVTGGATASPWPFRVDAATGLDVRDPYCGQVVGALRLFRELGRLGLGDTTSYAKAHDAALSWALSFAAANDNWTNYFEDVWFPNGAINNNQYAPLELARYLLEHPDVAGGAQAKAKSLVDWVASVFGQDFTYSDGTGFTLFQPGMQWGAEVIGEQDVDKDKMGSHTSRFASLLALYYEKTGDAASRARAFRSFNWATYCSTADGIVAVGPNPVEGYWYTDGYGDYIRHFMAGLGAVPEWAPPGENHLVRSSSVVKSVAFAAGSLTYTTFDATADDVLRLAAAPSAITVGGAPLATGTGSDTYTVAPVQTGGVVVLLSRTRAATVTVTF